MMLSLVRVAHLNLPSVQDCQTELRETYEQDQDKKHDEGEWQSAQKHVFQLDPVIVQRGFDDKTA